MNKKGFTLIELLAVIAILAIIALITIPIITDSIDESRKSSVLRSTELYIHAVDNAVGTKNLDAKFNLRDGWYNINSNGDLCLNKSCSNTLPITAKSKPSGGKVYLKKNVVDKVTDITYSNFYVSTDTTGSLVLSDTPSEESGTPTTDATTRIVYVANEGFFLQGMYFSDTPKADYVWCMRADGMNTCDVQIMFETDEYCNNYLDSMGANGIGICEERYMQITPMEYATDVEEINFPTYLKLTLKGSTVDNVEACVYTDQEYCFINGTAEENINIANNAFETIPEKNCGSSDGYYVCYIGDNPSNFSLGVGIAVFDNGDSSISVASQDGQNVLSCDVGFENNLIGGFCQISVQDEYY